MDSEKSKEPNKKLWALFAHWTTADAVSVMVTAPLRAKDRGPLPDGRVIAPEMLPMADAMSKFARLSVYYALLYVVIEGYQELGLSDPEIDKLLADEDRVHALKRFRNATFHYQKKVISPKTTKFLYRDDGPDWIQDLKRAFGRYFDREVGVVDMLERYGVLQDPGESEGGTKAESE